MARKIFSSTVPDPALRPDTLVDSPTIKDVAAYGGFELRKPPPPKPIAAPEKTRWQKFTDRYQSTVTDIGEFAAGRRQLTPLREDDGLIERGAKHVANFALGTIARPLIRPLLQASQAVVAPVGFAQLANQKKIIAQFEGLDKQVADQVKWLKTQPNGEARIKRLVETASRNTRTTPEIISPPNLTVRDRSVMDPVATVAQTAETALTALLLAGKHIGSPGVPIFGKAFTQLGLNPSHAVRLKGLTNVASSPFLKAFGIASAGTALEGMAFTTANRLTEEVPTKEEILSDLKFNVALAPFVIGAFTGLTGVNQQTAMAKYADDLAAAANLAKKEVNYSAPGAQKTRNNFKPGNKTIIKDQAAFPTKGQEVDTAVVQIGDIISLRTKDNQGLTIKGIVRGVRDVLDVPASSFDSSTLNSTASRELQTLGESIGRLEVLKSEAERSLTFNRSSKGTFISVSKEKSRIETINREIAALRRQSDDLSQLLKDPTQRTVQNAQRKRSVVLTVRESDGTFVNKVFPFEEIKGGNIISREVVTPSTAALQNANPALAKKQAAFLNQLKNSPLKDQKTTLRIPEGASSKSVTLADDAFRELQAAGLSDIEAAQFIEESAFFQNGFSPKNVSILDRLLLDKETFKKSGFTFKLLQQAERDMDVFIAGKSAKLNQLSAQVFKEAGLPDTGLGGVIGKFRTKSFYAKATGVEKRRNDLSARLFDAADDTSGELFSKLSTSEKRLVNEFRTIADEQLKMTNSVLKRIGKPEVTGRQTYITNVITDSARAFLETSGAVPGEIANLFKDDLLRVRDRGVVLHALKERTGGLPVKRDFFNAADVAIKSHAKFAFLSPHTSALETAAAAFQKVHGNAFPANTGRMEGILNRIKGNYTELAEIRGLDKRFESLAIHADKFLKQTNIFSEELALDLGQGIEKRRVVKKFVRDFPLRPGNIPRELKSKKYAIDLAFSPAYFVTNLTQFWLNVPPKLRGGHKAYIDSAVGWTKGLADLFSPKAWRKWQEAGVLTEVDNLVNNEFGRKGNGYLGEIFNLTSKYSEFINRVGAVHAQERNALRFQKGDRNAMYKQLDGLSGGKLGEEARKLASEISNVTQFKYGITHRAEIADHPIGALFDQYNSFVRNQFEFVEDMAQKFNHRYAKQLEAAGVPDEKIGRGAVAGLPNIPKAFKVAWKKDGMVGAMELAAKMPKEEGGELARYVLNTTALATILGSVGYSMINNIWDNEIYTGGVPRAVSGLADIAGGMVDFDINRIRRGSESIFIPPSIPPAFAAGRDVFSGLHGAGDYKYALIEEYSPFKKPYKAVQAFKAAMTNEAQPIIDPATGRVSEWIHPDEAMRKLFFGSRAIESKERIKLIEEISRARSNATVRQKKELREASEMLAEIREAPLRERALLMADWQAEGKLDEGTVERMARMNMEQILLSDAITAMTRTVPEKEKAVYIDKFLLPGKDTEEVAELLTKMHLEGNVTLETLARLNAIRKNRK